MCNYTQENKRVLCLSSYLNHWLSQCSVYISKMFHFGEHSLSQPRRLFNFLSASDIRLHGMAHLFKAVMVLIAISNVAVMLANASAQWP